MKALVLGYYNQFNLGDDIFQYIIPKILGQEHQYVFSEMNAWVDNKDNKSKEYSVIILGGGDIVNDYFTSSKNLNVFEKHYYNTPIIFLGIGIQYPDNIYRLDIGDYFYIRNRLDYITVRDRFSADYARYIPDLAYYMHSEPWLTKNKRSVNLKATTTNVALCIPNGFNMDLLYNVIDYLLYCKCKITFIPFNTIDINHDPRNSDLIIWESIKKKYSDNVEIAPFNNNVSVEDRIKNVVNIFCNQDLIIASRFHSLMLSIMTNTPFITLFSDKQKKIKNLLPEMELLNDCFINTDGINNLMTKFTSSFKYINNKRALVVSNLKATLDAYIFQLPELNMEMMLPLRYIPPRYISPEDKRTLITQTISNVLDTVNKKSNNNIDKLLKGQDLSSVFVDNSQACKKNISEEILWTITRDPYAPYYYGLNSNLYIGSIFAKIDWIICDYYYKYNYRVNHYNVINKNFQELHRSGWQFIINSLVSSSTCENLIIDTYVDKTFHWNATFYQCKKIIPYTSHWIGFIHHTYSDYNNSYNCAELFENSLFLKSLDHCKCLIVMTDYLANQIKSSLIACGKEFVPVRVIYHPSEETVITFEWNKFILNENKKLVQIGNWLRNVFSIYEVILPKDSFVSQKCILVNKNSENYIIEDGFIDLLFMNTLNYSNPWSCIDICKNAFQNMAVKGMYDYLKKMTNQVELLEYLNNEDYDELISNNIIFVNYIDASATNTLIECIMRNTPIIINKIEPIVEILGEDYPLYYTDVIDVGIYLKPKNLYMIQNAYTYLLNMDKSKFLITHFLAEFQSILDELTTTMSCTDPHDYHI